MISANLRNSLRVSLGVSSSNELILLLDRVSDQHKAEDDPARTTDEPNPGPDPNEAGVPVEPVEDADFTGDKS